MVLHKSLVRQIQKFLGRSPDTVPAAFLPFLEAISSTYTHFDEDRALTLRSLELTSHEMGMYVAQLRATLDATTDGILVVDTNGKIVTFNTQFQKMWKIPQEIINTRDDNKALEFVLSQLTDPNAFIKKVRELYGSPEEESFDTLLFKDGHVFERYSRPQKSGTATIGRVWSFRDTTDKRKAEYQLQQKIEELEALNKLMVGREMRMIELKNEIAQLRQKVGGGAPPAPPS